MKEEKKQELKEKKEIVVLDAGIDMDAIIGPTGVCCWGAFSPLI